jgi:glycerol-3-phosphate dehydrogenase
LTRPTGGIGALDGERFEVVIIGGGVLGAGLASELARRGQRCLLVEQHDFGWGTTGRSTRLIHGGLRYLAHLDFSLVREGLAERAWQLRRLPHLVTPLPFLLPFYRASFGQRLQLRAGLVLYDLLAPRTSLPNHGVLSAADVVEREPGLTPDGLRAAALYWDAQLELPERLIVELLREADEHGAVVRNHIAACGLQVQAGRVVGVELEGRTDEQRARVRTERVVNASGPWIDATLEAFGVRRSPLLRLSQGVHLVYPRLVGHAVAVPHPDDGRLCFAVPWQGRTLVGTTETELADGPADARIRPGDVRYLRRLAERYLPASRQSEPIWGSVGVRALALVPGRLGAISRRHRLVDHRRDGVAGLITLAGGKLTAWRAIAAEVADLLDVRRPIGAGRGRPCVAAEPAPQPPAADPVGLRHWRLYGDRASELGELVAGDPSLGEALLDGSPATRGEVIHAVDREWAGSVSDIVLRRLALGFGADLGQAAAEAVAALARDRLGWDERRIQREMAAFEVENAERRLPAPDGRPIM